jgi:RNA polymerase sigma factor (sigma-70 family)
MTAMATDEQLSDLFPAIRAGDREARNRLVTSIYQRLIKLSAVLLRTFPIIQRNREVESVANDLSIKLITALDAKLQTASVAEFFQFAGLRLRHMLIDEAKKVRRRSLLAEGAPKPTLLGIAGGDSDSQFGQVEPGDWSMDPAMLAEWTDFHAKVDSLPELERDVFTMHFFLKMPQSEVAKVLGMEPKQVSRTWLLACVKLSDHLPTMSG